MLRLRIFFFDLILILNIPATSKLYLLYLADIVTRRYDPLRWTLPHLCLRQQCELAVPGGWQPALAHASDLLVEIVPQLIAVLVHLLLEIGPPIVNAIWSCKNLWSLRFVPNGDCSLVTYDPRLQVIDDTPYLAVLQADLLFQIDVQVVEIFRLLLPVGLLTEECLGVSLFVCFTFELKIRQ